MLAETVEVELSPAGARGGATRSSCTRYARRKATPRRTIDCGWVSAEFAKVEMDAAFFEKID